MCVCVSVVFAHSVEQNFVGWLLRMLFTAENQLKMVKTSAFRVTIALSLAIDPVLPTLFTIDVCDMI